MVLDGSRQNRLAPLVAQHRLQQECRGGLAIGAGDAAEFELRFGMREEIRGNGSQCASPMRHFDHGYGRICGGRGEARSGIRDDGSRTLGDGLRNIAIAVGRAPRKATKSEPSPTRRESYSTPVTAGLGPARRMRSTPRKTTSRSTSAPLKRGHKYHVGACRPKLLRALFLCVLQYPRRLKPVHLDVQMDGLKPVPFIQRVFPQPAKAHRHSIAALPFASRSEAR